MLQVLPCCLWPALAWELFPCLAPLPLPLPKTTIIVLALAYLALSRLWLACPSWPFRLGLGPLLAWPWPAALACLPWALHVLLSLPSQNRKTKGVRA